MTQSLNDPLAFEQAARARLSRLPGEVDLEIVSAVFNLVRIVNRLLSDFETSIYRPRDLTWAGFRVLFSLWVQPASPPARLAHLSGVSRATVSSVLNTLERKGLVSRHRRSLDRRVVTVTLTGAGERLITDAFVSQHSREGEWMANLAPDQVVTLNELLRSLLTSPAPPKAGAAPSADDVTK